MDNLGTQSYNVEEATSRIGDTDMATEMTNYTELNVLEQATSTILSKANQRAETILQLLQS
jgi:flagellin